MKVYVVLDQFSCEEGVEVVAVYANRAVAEAHLKTKGFSTNSEAFISYFRIDEFELLEELVPAE